VVRDTKSEEREFNLMQQQQQQQRRRQWTRWTQRYSAELCGAWPGDERLATALDEACDNDGTIITVIAATH